jgi:hypothetical protein
MPSLSSSHNTASIFERRASVARAFAFPYYYFSRSGRLPHAGWTGTA